LNIVKEKLEKKAIIEVNSKLLIIMKLNNHTISLFPQEEYL
jgi:hypothetical protein